MDLEIEEILNWKNLRETLKENDFEYHTDWEKAIVLFKTRLDRKFFDPIELLIKKNRQKGEGFTIVTTQCALIESLASFRTGQIYNHQINNASPKFEYNKSRKMFVDFLHSDEIFKDNFWSLDANGNKILDRPFNAGMFYSDVRCGLMHEARTKNEWFINTTKGRIQTEKIFLEFKNRKIRILRSVLHYRLKHAVNIYCSDLKKVGHHYNLLRKFFGRKLDHLFDIERDISFEWWSE